MKFILFCQNNYAFGILEPLKRVIVEKGHDYIWFVADKIVNEFPFKTENHTNLISDLESYKTDVIFVPGNQVPHYLRGLKTQIFHGLAGEKKGHFRIRHYFDLYLTQGPYFTDTFNQLKQKHKDFDALIKKNFLKDYELAGSNEYDDWQDSPLGSLALVILFDQFSRNMFRDNKRAFEQDSKTRLIVHYAIKSDFLKEMDQSQRFFH